MYMMKYEVLCTVFENWINNIKILTTENCTGAINNTVFSSSMLRERGGYFGVKRIGMTIGNPRKLP